jgi:catalase
MPPKRQKDQAAPKPASPTGVAEQVVDGRENARAQAGEYLTTAQGVRLPDTDHSLKAGRRGPTLMEDFHLREKITHFDHERIPERVVHARGAAAHGTFQAYGNAEAFTGAGFLREGRRTPVFVRFSTVVGSRGSADTVRDVRGFAVKFYTEEGNFDLVGNNMPVFFIQDGIKFPDVIHAAKPHPDREIPQAQTAHDTFWDFVSLHTEATHHVMWAMSDRGIPRSYRTMEGFGVHTFRLVNAAGETSLVKFHWKPVAGIHSLVWEEAQLAAGTDPDFHRRDMADGIEAGGPLEYELGLQILPDTEDQTFEGIDLLDPTKIVPEELAEVRLVGRLTLDRNPTNYFAETEQVAFHTGNLVPGIEVTDDPLMQARLFSYLDTQLTRLGGPNFTQLPINCPHAAVNDNLRDGMHQTAVHQGQAPYLPNSVDGGRPQPAAARQGGYVHLPRQIDGSKVRESPASFDDHFSQATLFWASMSEIERVHIVEAFTFELGKCYEQPIRERMLAVLANVDADLCAAVAAGLGLPAPSGDPATGVTPSPALSQLPPGPGPITGRVIGVVAAPGADLAGIAKLRKAVAGEGRGTARHRPGRRDPAEGPRPGDRGAHPPDDTLHRVRRPGDRRRHRRPHRRQAHRAAAGGVPALQGHRRLGRRRPGPGGGRHRHHGSRHPARRRPCEDLPDPAPGRRRHAPRLGTRPAGHERVISLRPRCDPKGGPGLRKGGSVRPLRVVAA